ncbi:MAG: nucleotidyltransferase domain-containing protein [Bryobacteraceae bacterium]
MTDREDEWSDIDLAFGVIDADEVPNILSDWTAHLYEQYRALHHVDVRFRTWIYRVFLLPDTMQVDLAFTPATEFRALSPAFRLVFGKANDTRPAAPQPVADVIGMGWLYTLHARSCIARGKAWQAEYMISGIRDSALAVACIHHGIPAVYGRGFDRLPRAVTAPLEGSLVRGLDAAELARAFRVAVDGLLGVIGRIDEELAGRLRAPLTSLTETTC